MLPHVLVATDPHRILRVEQDVAWLLDCAAEYLQTRGEPAPARPLFERALDLRRSRLGDDHPDTLESASNLAFDLLALGQYEQARQLAEDTLTRRRRVLGDDHPDTLISANNLPRPAGSWVSTSRPASSTRTPSPAAAGSWATTTPTPCSRPSTSPSTCARWGTMSRPASSAEDTLTRRRRVLGDDHPDTLSSATSLAVYLRELGQYSRPATSPRTP